MKKLLEVYNQVNRFGIENNLELTIVNPGEIIYKMKVQEKHLATPNTIHGGMVAAMMDGVIGVAGLSIVASEKKLVSTVEFKISYYNPSSLGDILTGKGIVDKKGKRLIYASGEIYNQNNLLIAKAMGTLNAYPVQKSDLTEYI